MPTSYAHYRFGAEMLRLMPADMRGTAKRHRQLFDVGLYGPDPLFFYRPALSGKIRRLGRMFHMQTGQEFFCRVCRNLRMNPSEGGQAYLYGVLCHFALDACCHPLVAQAVRESNAGHIRIEQSFDRFLAEEDGIEKTELTAHMALTDQECGIVSRFYPGTDNRSIRESIKSMSMIHKILEMQEGSVRTALVKAFGFTSEYFRDMLLGQKQDGECARWNQLLLERYRQAGEAFPDMLLKLSAHLTYNAPLGEKFDPIFG